MSPRLRGVALAAAALACLGAAEGDPVPGDTDWAARGDAAWAGRAEGGEAGRARPEPILSAVDAYERALARQPDSLEVRWKLLRALHFAGDFAAGGDFPGSRFFERARVVAEEGLDRLADRAAAGERLDELEAPALLGRVEAAGLPAADVARLHFWSALNWGVWARSVGLLSAVRRGAANRLFRYASVTQVLEPGYEEGGALRLLGRLHAELPRVPFVSGWVDRSQAIPLVERAYALAPENPGNRLLLALTLLDLAPERSAEAFALIEQVASLDPRASMLVEDLAMREEARKRLAAREAREQLAEQGRGTAT